MKIKRINQLLIFLVVMGVVLPISAKTTVVLFTPALSNSDAYMEIDGKKVCDLNAPIFKTISMPSDYQKNFEGRQKGMMEMDFDNEGKVLVTLVCINTNCKNLKKTTLQAEKQLDLIDGETIYIELAGKGWSDMQIKTLNEKKAQKKLKDKKRYIFPAIEYHND